MIKLTNPEIEQVLVFSTTHITKEDDYKLSTLTDSELMIDKHEYGYRVYISNVPHELESIIYAIREEGMSEAFINLYKLAHSMGVQWIKFDCDGTIYKELPTFSW